MNLAPLLLLAVLAVAGCTGTAAREDLQEATTTTSNRTTSTTRSTTSSTTATSTTGSSASTSSSTTIHTDGGDVTVRARNGRLEFVEVDAAEGWTSDHRVEHPGSLIVSFERQGGRVDVTVELTPTGIVTSTRSVSTG